MDWKALKERLAPAEITSTADFRLPSVLVEVQPEFVVGAKLDASSRKVRHLAVRSLEPKSLDPHPGRSNVADAGAVRAAVRSVLDAVGDGTARKGLLVSDAAVRVAVLPFDTIPEGRKELEALVRWRMKQNFSYPPEEARVSYQVMPREPVGFDVLALAIRESNVAQYESALEVANGGCELILPTTAALLPLLSAGERAAQLLMNLCAGWITSVVVCGGRVCFWRTREIGSENPQEEARAVSTEAARVVASSRDHMHLEMGRVWLCARPSAAPADLAVETARAISQEVKVLAPSVELGASLHGQERSAFERFGTAVAGLLMNA